jgi:hypothetical protein
MEMTRETNYLEKTDGGKPVIDSVSYEMDLKGTITFEYQTCHIRIL